MECLERAKDPSARSPAGSLITGELQRPGNARQPVLNPGIERFFKSRKVKPGALCSSLEILQFFPRCPAAIRNKFTIAAEETAKGKLAGRAHLAPEPGKFPGGSQ